MFSVSNARSKLKFNASAVALLAIGLSACSGGGGSSTPAPTPTPQPITPTGDSFSLSGKVQKGVILNGYVKVVDAANNDTILIDNQRTDSSSGSYNLTIPTSANFTVTDALIKVIISGGEGASMICDASSGCGNSVAFGDTFAIGDDTSISAIIAAPSNGESSIVHVSALTDMTAKLVEERTEQGVASINAESLASSESQIANLFGLTVSNFASIEPVDITDESAEAVNSSALFLSLLNAGIMEAVVEGTGTIGDNLDAFITAFVENDGQLVVNEGDDSGSVFSVEDILDGAANAAAITEVEDESLALIQAEINDDLTTINALPEDVISDAVPSPNASASNLEKAKAFVSDFRLIQAAIDRDESVADIDSFADDIRATSELVSNDTEALLSDIVVVIEKMAEAYDAHTNDTTLQSYDTSMGFSVNIASLDAGISLTVKDANLNGGIISLNAQIDENLATSSPSRPDNAYDFFFGKLISGDIDFEFSGTASNDNVSLTLSNGNLFLTGFEQLDSYEEFSSDQFNSHDQSTLSLGELLVAFDTEIETFGQAPFAFSGQFTAGVLNLFDGSDFFSFTSNSSNRFGSENFVVDVSETEIGASFLGVSGELSQGTKAVDVSLTLDTFPKNLQFGTEPNTGTAATYTNKNNIVTVTSSISGAQMVLEVKSIEDFTDEIIQIFGSSPGDGFASAKRNGIDYYAFLPSTTSNILRIDLIDSNGSISEVNYLQSSTVYRVFGGARSGNAANISGTSDFWNTATGARALQEVECVSGNLVVFDPFEFHGSNGTIGYTVVKQGCDVSGQTNTAPITAFETIDVDALISASIRQNVIGINPNDSEVELSVSADTTATGLDESDVDVNNLSIKLSFAGRTFETNSSSLDIIEGLSATPLLIRNQDGVELSISESNSGVVSGSISIGAEQLGTITEESGAYVVTYTDDTFETLF